LLFPVGRPAVAAIVVAAAADAGSASDENETSFSGFAASAVGLFNRVVMPLKTRFAGRQEFVVALFASVDQLWVGVFVRKVSPGELDVRIFLFQNVPSDSSTSTEDFNFV